MIGDRGKPLGWGECVLWAGVLFGVQIASFPGAFFQHEVLSASDLLYEVAPWRDHRPADFDGPANILMYDPVMAFRPDFQRFQAALREAHWPLWNNLEMAGLPLLANCQSRVFYPPHLALAFLDVDTAMSVFVVFKIWLAAFVAYVCARALGFGVWPSRWYSIAWGLGCFVRIWAYWPITDVLAWVPVVFLGTEWLIERRYRKGSFALALGGAMLLFAGHPETAFVVNAYIALYFAVRLAFAWRAGNAPWRPAACYAGAWALALAVYAVQLVPFIEYLMNAAPVEERVDMPLTFGALATFWVPRFFGTNAEDTFWDKGLHNSNLSIQQYAGMAAWLGVACAIVFVMRKSSAPNAAARARAATLGAVSLLSLAMAMDLPFVHWAQDLPGFSHTRTIYHVYFALFALPLLGLIGLDAWFARNRRVREVAALAVTLLPAVAIVGSLWWYNGGLLRLAKLDGYVTHEVLTACAAAGASIALVSLHCFTRRTALPWAALAALTLCDVFWPVRGLNTSLPRADLPGTTPLVAYLDDKAKPCRIDCYGAAIAPGAIGNFGIEEWDGYDGLYPERPVRFRKELSTDIWDRLVAIIGVDYYLHDPRHEEMVPIKDLSARGAIALESTQDAIEVYRHTGALPRARLVGTVETARDTDGLFKRMLEDSFDPACTAITAEPPNVSLPAGGAIDAGSATITAHESDRVAVDCEAKADAVLVLAENFYPGWRATVDGVETPMFPVYHTFRGVIVPQGRHTIEFSYAPRSVVAGAMVSVGAMLASACAAIAALRRRTTRTSS